MGEFFDGVLPIPRGLTDGGGGRETEVFEPFFEHREDAGDIFFAQGRLDHDGEAGVGRWGKGFCFFRCFENRDLARGFSHDAFHLFMTVAADEEDVVFVFGVGADQIMQALDKGAGGVGDLETACLGGALHGRGDAMCAEQDGGAGRDILEGTDQSGAAVLERLYHFGIMDDLAKDKKSGFGTVLQQAFRQGNRPADTGTESSGTGQDNAFSAGRRGGGVHTSRFADLKGTRARRLIRFAAIRPDS